MMDIKNWIAFLAIGFVLNAYNVNAQEQNQDMETFINDLLSKMTLEEKVGQMNQYTGFFDVTGPAPDQGNNKLKYEQIKNGFVGSMLNVKGVDEVRKMQELAVENSRLGIPMVFGYDVIHGHKTIMPIPLGESASWDLELIKKSAQIAAKEAAAEGLNWTFAPMVDIGRDPRWGRVMEGAGEDVYLGSRIAEARVKGFQGEDLSSPLTVAACAKHFAAYGLAEGGRDYNTADIGTVTLFNHIFPPFIAAKEAGVATFMNSFNELNGVPATGDKWIQRDLLKGEWEFDGMIVSDWGSISEMIPHGFAKDDKDAGKIAALAGSDMDMESNIYINHLQKLVEEGEVPMDVIDDSVKRILRLKYQLGLFEDPYKYCSEEREDTLIFHKSHMDASLEIAKNSIVLLKNENQILPLKKSGLKIAVIGELAESKNSQLGNWRLAAEENSAVSLLEGLNQYGGNSYIYEKGVDLFEGQEHFVFELNINTTDTSGMAKAVELAKDADVVIMALGEHGLQSGEGRSRRDIGLPGLQQEMLEAVHAVNSNIVLVLTNGRPLAIEWADENIPAIVECWQLGSQAGNAIAEVLYGDHNPSGKLPMTFPRSVGQIPVYYNHKNTGRPGPKGEVFWTHYIDGSREPLYPFGYGLSYSTFEYSNLSTKVEGNLVKVFVDVTNSSKIDGKEVVQLYIRDKVASITQPVKSLKAFEKEMIKAGQTKTMSFELTKSDLGFYDGNGKFVFEPGEFDIMIGDLQSTIVFGY